MSLLVQRHPIRLASGFLSIFTARSNDFEDMISPLSSKILRVVIITAFFHANFTHATQSPALKDRLQKAIGKGRVWLEQNQNAALGSWGNPDHPALTALAVLAIKGDRNRPKSVAVQNAYAFVRSQAKADGGLYGRGLVVYNTALCLSSLLLDDNQQSLVLIPGAKRFLQNHRSGLDFRAEDADESEIDSRADFSSTLASLRQFEAGATDRPSKVKDSSGLNWDAAIKFVESYRKPPGTDGKRAPIISPTTESAGTGKKASADPVPGRKVALRYSGSMSYDSLLSLVYDKLETDDDRIVAFINWLQQNYTVEENPGLGSKGLYYYYHSIAKVLSIRKIERLKLKDGQEIDWRTELTQKILAAQREDGSWVNANGHWWESDPVLTCSYAMLTLQQIAAGL
ncbi:MAG: cycloartenol synthase-like protein [Verrucomicrobiaceae bacterium]|nr:cycloartenol synthase-like protein [Verrucomicrobiaceae bacterium]